MVGWFICLNSYIEIYFHTLYNTHFKYTGRCFLLYSQNCVIVTTLSPEFVQKVLLERSHSCSCVLCVAVSYCSARVEGLPYYTRGAYISHKLEMITVLSLEKVFAKDPKFSVTLFSKLKI